MNFINQVYIEDAVHAMLRLPNDSVDLVFISPPYADKRKKVYDSVSEHEYVNWFKDYALEIFRVLKPTGSFFLNIKPHTKKGERSLYVFDLVLSMKRGIGFNFIDEYSWIQTDPFPGKYYGKFKNAFEPIYHFSKSDTNEIKFNPLACGTPIQEVSLARAGRKRMGQPKNGSGLKGMNTENIANLEFVRPSNVLMINNLSNQNTKYKIDHSATFPVELPEFFIKSFTDEGDLVADFFVGSGTTAEAAIRNKRNYFVCDNNKKHKPLILGRIKDAHSRELANEIPKIGKEPWI